MECATFLCVEKNGKDRHEIKDEEKQIKSSEEILITGSSS